MKITVLHLIIITGLFAHLAHSWTPKPVDEDPLVRMPGTQPGQVVDLESDKQCLSCHGGATYEMANWKGWAPPLVARTVANPKRGMVAIAGMACFR